VQAISRIGGQHLDDIWSAGRVPDVIRLMQLQCRHSRSGSWARAGSVQLRPGKRPVIPLALSRGLRRARLRVSIPPPQRSLHRGNQIGEIQDRGVEEHEGVASQGVGGGTHHSLDFRDFPLNLRPALGVAEEAEHGEADPSRHRRMPYRDKWSGLVHDHRPDNEAFSSGARFNQLRATMKPNCTDSCPSFPYQFSTALPARPFQHTDGRAC